MVDLLFHRDSYVFGDFGGGDLCGITTEKRKIKNEKEGKRDWAADSASGSVLLVGGLHEG